MGRRNLKSPLGLTPKFIWEEKRIQDIEEAIDRFKEAKVTIPIEWFKEYNELILRRE